MHERRVRSAQSRGADAPSLGATRCQSLQYNVGSGGEFAHPRLSFVRVEVGDQALLAAVPHEETARVLAAKSVSLRGLNLDDPCAGVGQHHPSDRGPDAAGAHLEHEQAVTDATHGVPPRRYTPESCPTADSALMDVPSTARSELVE